MVNKAPLSPGTIEYVAVSPTFGSVLEIVVAKTKFGVGVGGT